MSIENPTYWVARTGVLARVGDTTVPRLCFFTTEAEFTRSEIGTAEDRLYAGTSVAAAHLYAPGDVYPFSALMSGVSSAYAGAGDDYVPVHVRGNSLLPIIGGRAYFFSGITGGGGSLEIVPDQDARLVDVNVALVAERDTHSLYAWSAYTGACVQADLKGGKLSSGDAFRVGPNVALGALRNAELQGFCPFTCTWASAGVRVPEVFEHDCYAGANLALVVDRTGGALHAFSTLFQTTDGLKGGKWSSYETPVSGSDVVRVCGNVALVAQPSAGRVLAYSAITGEWAPLEGYAPHENDEFLVGTDAWDPPQLISEE